MNSQPDRAAKKSAEQLMDRVRKEGPVLLLPGDVVGIFDPGIALKVDKINSEHLKVIDSFLDALKLRNHEPVTWREVRSLLIEKSASLTTSKHMRELYARMHAGFTKRIKQEQDATNLVWRTISQALIPLVIDGLDDAGQRKIIIDQEVRFRIQLEQRITIWQHITDFIKSRAATSVVGKEMRRRARCEDEREDFSQAILGLRDRIGFDRVAYLVTVQLIAISGVPGMMGACMLYAMTQWPEWRERIRMEVAALEPGEIFELPARKLSCTIRFIKEAMRLWTTPFVTRRRAQTDINIDNAFINKDQWYELSSYVQHHSQEYWENPEVFDPNRWLPERRQPAKSSFVPFGFAPRSCVGASVGHGLLILFAALVVTDFEFHLASDSKPSMRMDGFAIPTGMRGMFTPIGV